MASYVVGILIFSLVSIVISAIYVALYGSHRALHDRFDEMALKLRISNPSESLPADNENGMARSMLQWAAERMPDPKDTPAVEKVSKTLVRAGFMRSSTIRIYRLIRLLSFVGGALIGIVAGFVLGPSNKMMVFAIAGAAVGACAPSYYLSKRARRRQRDIAHQLSDVLDLLVVCIEAGLGLFEAIKIVGDETDRQGQAIGTELTLVSGEVSAGASLGEALRSLAESTSVEDIKPLAATLIQSEQLGAQIGPALRSSSDALRIKRRFRAEEAAQKCTVKILFPLVLFVLPAMLIAILAPAMIQAMRTLSSQ